MAQLCNDISNFANEDLWSHKSVITCELDTVIGSDLFGQDEYIKQYLLDPDLSLISKIKIGLRYYITAQPELILQLANFKCYLKEINPFLYMEVFGKDRKDSKKWQF